MEAITLNPALLQKLASKTAIITGAAGGIGSETARLFVAHGANVVIADLAQTRPAAEKVIASLSDPSRAIFVPANTLDWEQMKALYKTAIERFGSVEVVVANAGVMEGHPVLDADRVDETGDPVEPKEAYRVIDINVKGTLNTLLLALHYMKDNAPAADGSRGSIVLVSSVSGYFGGTGVVGYVTSKHGITGLLRSSQVEAAKRNVRINAIAPFVTPSAMSAGFAKEYVSRGLEANTPEGVATAIADIAMDETRRGDCFMTCGKIIREMESSLKRITGVWLGNDAAETMAKAGSFFTDIGGYVLPKLAAISEANNSS
ncbi:hypothetical protein A1O1_02881 [Capronia coronata CBS 617.96]|uniref:Uncharacterized protein n=1 Tax=Capronia coronata CBS 617.96 TaxID=1182541 RepID=W9YXT8_9EURO|nr:uncharacterized protein A1O1_02881 [Capronia coronata CBS 617.96]EXJ94485.1 hypothetical protein A1O1_02881 [Capronia coronata CBS 617.96]